MHTQVRLKEISVAVRRNPRAKRIMVKLRHGEVELIIPKRAPEKIALRFLKEKEGWIREKLADEPEITHLDIGARFTVLGKDYVVRYGGLRGKSTISQGEIMIYGDRESAPKKVRKIISDHLKAKLKRDVEKYASEIGKKYGKISIRDNVSRWGSCSANGNLSFCWRIAFAPKYVVEYLAAHEVAHLREMNHSRKYWQIVESIFPHYEMAEAWLKENGNSLHYYN